jgi:hypothetical protein
MKRGAAFALALVSSVLAACASTPPMPLSAEPTRTPPPSATPAQAEDMTRVDSQGAVVVAVTPIDLADEINLRFEVQMDTHSVDLSMDLAPRAELLTNLGASIPAVSWDGQLGGHHVSGTLTFPAQQAGDLILAGARQIVLVLQGIDVSERRFVWELTP